MKDRCQAILQGKMAEKAKAAIINEPSEPVGSVPNDSERSKDVSESDESWVKELERENLDLKFADRGKDYFIEQLQKERDGFFEKLLTASRKVGELETKLLQLDKPMERKEFTG